jgi:Protein of unknown function (DUF2637)
MTTSKTDRLTVLLAGLAVAVLGGLSAAISYTHTVRLAELHGEHGWRAHTLPLSVDGLEVVATLVLLADHRTGRRDGRWLPWLALAAGTVASLTANILVAEPTAVGRTISAWPAVAFLVGIKLGSRMLASSGPVPEPAEPPAPARPDPPTQDHNPAEQGIGPDRPSPERRLAAVTWCQDRHRETGRWPTGTEIAHHWKCSDRNGRKVRAAAQAAHLQTAAAS